jgi:hypothetical protein
MSISLARHFGMRNRPVCMICRGQTMNVTRTVRAVHFDTRDKR